MQLTARRLHRWLGLVLGAGVLVVGLTGATLIYWHGLEEVAMPRPAAPSSLPLQALLDAAGRHRDEMPWRIFPADELSHHARAIFPSTAGRVTLYLDPSSGAVQSSLPWRGSVVHWFYDMHAHALAGRTGKLLVGLSAFPLLLGIILGLRLWLRRGAVPVAEAVWPQRGLRGRRRLSNLHRTVGFWALLPLLLATLSAMPVSFPDTTRRVLEPILPPAPAFRVPQVKGTGPVDLDGAAAVARAALPGWRLAWAEPADPPEEPDWLLVMLPEHGAWPSGRAAAYVDARTGRLEEVNLPDGVDHARAWFRAFHEGRVFGQAHRMVMLASGLAMVALAVLGVLLWRRGRPVAAA